MSSYIPSCFRSLSIKLLLSVDHVTDDSTNDYYNCNTHDDNNEHYRGFRLSVELTVIYLGRGRLGRCSADSCRGGSAAGVGRLRWLGDCGFLGLLLCACLLSRGVSAETPSVSRVFAGSAVTASGAEVSSGVVDVSTGTDVSSGLVVVVSAWWFRR